jgi:hypothetical protein
MEAHAILGDAARRAQYDRSFHPSAAMTPISPGVDAPATRAPTSPIPTTPTPRQKVPDPAPERESRSRWFDWLRGRRSG